MSKLTGSQRLKGRGLAHHLKPVVQVGKLGLTDALIASTEEALLVHELIKVKFVDHKGEKKEIAAALAEQTESELLGLVGNIAILYRQHPEPDRRKIVL